MTIFFFQQTYTKKKVRWKIGGGHKDGLFAQLAKKDGFVIGMLFMTVKQKPTIVELHTLGNLRNKYG